MVPGITPGTSGSTLDCPHIKNSDIEVVVHAGKEERSSVGQPLAVTQVISSNIWKFVFL